MAKETLQEQVKVLQNYIGGFAKMLKDQSINQFNQSINQFIISNFSINTILPADNLLYYTFNTTTQAILLFKEEGGECCL